MIIFILLIIMVMKNDEWYMTIDNWRMRNDDGNGNDSGKDNYYDNDNGKDDDSDNNNDKGYDSDDNDKNIYTYQ